MAETAVITNTRRELLCKVTSGKSSTMPPITHIAFGAGGVNANGNPIAPASAQTTLNMELSRYAVASIEYPSPTVARYTAVIPADDLIGAKISEAALIDAVGNLAAIKTMFVKQKDDGVELVFVFDDEF